MTAAEPSPGRIVHYVSRDRSTPECQAAIVTQVSGHAARPPDLEETGSWVVGIAIFTPTGLSFNPSVVQMEDGGHDPGTWHWPERVE